MNKKDNITNVRSKIRWGIVGILVLLLVTSFFDAPVFVNRGIDKVNETTHIGIPRLPEKGFNLGLDLQGGAHLIYQADVTGIENVDRAEAVEGVRDVIERRVNAIGVGEPNIQTAKVGNDYRINVELPGVTDVNEAIKLIGETPILEFKEQNEEAPRELSEEEQKELDEFNAAAEEKINEALQKLKQNVSFEDLVQEYSEDEASKSNGGYLDFVEANSEYGELHKWASEVKEGYISRKLIDSREGYNILRRGKEEVADPKISAQHILICYVGAEGCTSDEYLTKESALNKAQGIFDQVNADNFTQLAQEFSTDPTAKDTGGNLGFFGRGDMVKPFEDAVYAANVGDIIGPVETNFGFHVIYKLAETEQKKYEIYRILVRTKSSIDILPPQDPFKNTGLSGKQLERAQVVTDQQTGEVQVSLQFDSEGTELFKDITTKNLGKPVAIFLDGEPISIPVVQSAITNGQAVITGGFSVIDARLLAQRLNAGALPVPVELIAQQSVGASLGAESLAKSLYAGAIALVLVMVFMLLYYRLPGLLSVIALSLYLSLTLAIFKLIGVTLTLAGIAGFILSIGMAVDANVLIFERLKEELKKGKSLKGSVEEGFARAWTAIKDGNVSTIITCVLLIWFGSSFVQGFAFTLAIGVLISMFSAITITRVMLKFVVYWFSSGKGKWMFLGWKDNK